MSDKVKEILVKTKLTVIPTSLIYSAVQSVFAPNVKPLMFLKNDNYESRTTKEATHVDLHVKIVSHLALSITKVGNRPLKLPKTGHSTHKD